MVPIKVDKFAKMYVESNKGEKLDDVIERLKYSLNRKNSGVKCSCCKTESIWVIGSALGGLKDVLHV